MELRLTAAAILGAWEIGAARRPLDRAIAILWAAGAVEDIDPADLSLAERDRLLLSIRANTFGPTLPACATCPSCNAELEMELDAGRLIDSLPAIDTSDQPLRLLTSRDLAAICNLAPDKQASEIRARLCNRKLTDGEAEVIDQRIEQQVVATELYAEITCSECNAGWSESLDVTSHIWAEIEMTALGLLGEVSEIAAAYGWSEGEILSMSAARRTVYLTQARRA
ncbi:hypothetical protein [Microbulbifer epialgicus]|uniref:Phage baseplate protein n=1 Tax=Microbulbifer epialgicus TaxID=393907 RepID=A0ABV4NYK4_9GAMM